VQKVGGKVERWWLRTACSFPRNLDGKLIAFGKERIPVRTHLENPCSANPAGAAGTGPRPILENARCEKRVRLCTAPETEICSPLWAIRSDLDIVAVETAGGKGG